MTPIRKSILAVALATSALLSVAGSARADWLVRGVPLDPRIHLGHSGSSGYIDHGPIRVAYDECRSGFVWREAFRGDHVCVTPGTRAQARLDNAAAYDRINPTNHDYGADTCQGGFVWRETTPRDHVCVTPGTRSQAASDNAEAASRYANP